LKIIGIPYFPHDISQEHLSSSDVENIIKQNQIFDNVVLTSKLQVIKVSPKSDISIIWIDIWNVQSRSKAKSLIDQCFNMERYITTIRGANINLSVPQCKNCWKWRHTTMFCRIQGSKYIKYNGPHKSKNHCQFSWCCKANKNTNSSHLETKEDEPCLHVFKCSNCRGNHQAICDVLKLFSQNVCKNSLIVNTILETQMSFDIIFIQEPPWSTIYTILSSTSSKGEELVSIPHDPNWLTFARIPTNQSDSPRVLTYINIHISCLCFSLQNDIFYHRDISCISFFNQGSILFLINVYLDSSQLALKYLKDTETNIHNIIIMTSDFNIRDSLWDSNFSSHSVHSDILFNIADSFSLAISKPTENFPTRFLDSNQNSNSVLDLVFL